MKAHVTATWGPMKFAPIKFYSFDVGPFVASVEVMPDETLEQAFKRAYAYCHSQAREAFKNELDMFLQFARLTDAAARG